MKQLPPALTALAQYRQFILWRLDGIVKKPVSPHTLKVCDPHDPAAWVSADEALAVGEATGLGLAFVFTRTDPFFFLDIDGCLQPDGTWSELATGLCSRFAGAAVEISQSGKGLHVFGTGVCPPHRCKNIPLHIELYTEARFVALTGVGAVGDAGTDHSTALAELVENCFKPDPPAVVALAPSVATGPDDDDELIRLMLSSRGGAGSIFGDKASVQDLWSANVDALARAYPPQNTVDPYDRSSADAALCQHLAFWSGRDAARIERLFARSGLVRDKWLERQDYRNRTVSRAVAQCTTVYNKKTSEPTPTSSTPLRVGFQFMTIQQQQDLFKGCVYVRDLHAIFVPDGGVLEQGPFRVTYGGHVFALDSMNDKTTKNAWEAFTESQGAAFPKAHSTCFRPELPPGAIVHEESKSLVNTYVPVQTVRAPGDVSPFLQLIEKLLPVRADRDILLAYMAALIQHPGVKFQWCPLIQGTEGNGKTLLIRCVAYTVGHRYTHLPNAQDIANKFNGWLANKLFIGVEELYVLDRREIADTLKPMITNDRIEYQFKGGNQYTGDNRANFITCSNHKDAVHKTRNDRRYAPFYCAQQDPEDLVRDGMSGDYFPRMYTWLRQGGYAIVAHYLANYAIPDALNPATQCHRAPETSSTLEAISLSLGGLEQEVLEAIAEARTGFAGGWISSAHLDRLLGAKGDRKRLTHIKRAAMLRMLGYAPHPGLQDGRASAVIPLDGCKPRLYVRHGSLQAQITGAKAIADAYIKAQAAGGAEEAVAAATFRS